MPLNAIVAAIALCAVLALAMARLGFPVLADALVLTAALGGVAVFASAVRSTLRRARRLPSKSSPP